MPDREQPTGKKRPWRSHVFDSLIRNKKIEWDQHRTQITEYEAGRYLPIL